MNEIKYTGPVVLLIMDGVGLSDRTEGNALRHANLPTLDHLMANYPTISLGAAGHYVGVPDGDSGNSEVGHNAMGAGQIIPQGPLRIQQAFDDGAVFATGTWKDAIKNVIYHNSTLHFIGIFSDGNVHNNIHQIFAMMKQAMDEGVARIRIHPAFDGRDTPPQSAEKYVKMFDDFVASLGNPDFKLADGGGRMTTWADRYENDWGVVENGWNIAVRGVGREFPDAIVAINTLRAEVNPTSDQYLPPFVLVDENGQPVGPIKKDDSVIYADFRADRAIMPSVAFTYYDFSHFDRGDFSPDDIYYAGVTEYNSDTHVPAHILVPPMSISHTLSDLLNANRISQYTISETVKYGHITYYFDGNHYLENSSLRNYKEVPSEDDTESIVTRPWMKSAEITDQLIAALESQQYQFLRVNYPNGDMVGHFAKMQPTIIAMEALDLAIERVVEVVNKLGGITIITSDHGNAEELADTDGTPRTAHTTNKVPCIFVDDTENSQKYHLAEGDFGLANLASTISTLLGVPPDPAWLPPIIKYAC